MQIQLEKPDKYSIQSYTDSSITVNGVQYHSSVIISPEHPVSHWSIKHPTLLQKDILEPILQQQPEIIIIGTNKPNASIPIALLVALSKERISIECMSIGAASRTFNVLLGEKRRIILGIILDAAPPTH